MGTRAMITINEKPFIATHWDGCPSSLGADLLLTKTEAEIIAVANDHTIDAACAKVCKTENKKRFQYIADKTKGSKKEYSAEDIEKLHKQGKCLQFEIMGADDWPISNIKGYDDWAEYQYDFSNGKWRYRPLSGSYNESQQSAGKFKLLTKKTVKDDAS